MSVRSPSDQFRRLRWRHSGAWQWPLFAALTVADAALLHWLPMSGTGTGWVPGLLLAGCLNLVAVAALGRAGGWLLRRRRPDLPGVVADDYAGCALLLAVAAVFLTIGLIHRPQIADDREAFADQSQTFRDWIAGNADAYARAHVDQADTLAVEPTLFRTCVPSPDPRRFTCAFVDTADDPPKLTPDRNRESNASLRAR